MKFRKFSFLFFMFLSLGCGHSQSIPSSLKQQNDQQTIHSVVKDLYKWLETERQFGDFIPVADSAQMMYTGIDSAKHYASLNELRASHFFSNEFLDSYDRLALNIDDELKTKTVEWFVGELPPFGNDANPWCNCQDPPEQFWERIEIRAFSIDNNLASFTWTWGDDVNYQMQAIKQNDTWTIIQMQGFKEF